MCSNAAHGTDPETTIYSSDASKERFWSVRVGTYTVEKNAESHLQPRSYLALDDEMSPWVPDSARRPAPVAELWFLPWMHEYQF